MEGFYYSSRVLSRVMNHLIASCYRAAPRCRPLPGARLLESKENCDPITDPLRLKNIAQAMEGYDTLANIYERKLKPRVDGVRNVIRLLGQTNEKTRKFKAEELVDDRFVRKLEKEGRF